jgi:hypothetical protein
MPIPPTTMLMAATRMKPTSSRTPILILENMMGPVGEVSNGVVGLKNYPGIG